jgi:hypothetical protein
MVSITRQTQSLIPPITSKKKTGARWAIQHQGKETNEGKGDHYHQGEGAHDGDQELTRTTYKSNITQRRAITRRTRANTRKNC